MLSSLERTFRVDAEFYQKGNIAIVDTLNRRTCKSVADVAAISDGNHASISDNFCAEGVPYYRGQDIHSFFIEHANPVCIDKKTFSLPVMRRSHLRKGDILLSIVGTIGGVSLVTTDREATCSCKLAIIRPKGLDESYLAVYLSSKFGQNQIKKFTRGAVQMGFILEDMNQILIPILPATFQQKIAAMVQEAHAKLEESKRLYRDAQKLLEEELWTTDEAGGFVSLGGAANVNIKNLSASFAVSGRLDAEYYQTKYDTLFGRLAGCPTRRLGELVEIKKSIEPGSDAYRREGIPFYRVSNLFESGLTETDIYLDPGEFADAPRIRKDTVLLSKDGSIGIAWKADRDIDAITSGAILHLQMKDKFLLPDCLALILNSRIVKMQAERDAGGSIIQHWKPDEIKSVVIPILPADLQARIADLIQRSFALKSDSKRLLERAKFQVEQEIGRNP